MRLGSFLTLGLLLSALILTAGPAAAVTVDIWQTGMTRQQVWDLARDRDIPLAPEGWLHRSTHFKPRYLVEDARTFYCRGRYFDQPATFYLRLTDGNADGDIRLYEIEVRYRAGANSPLVERIVRRLTVEMGRGETHVTSWRKEIVWHRQNLNVRLIHRGDRLRLIYTDLQWQRQQ
ncbi:hypothetical protein EDC39_102176 [Geothermobacter ehrlichii]|uniref:Uncharacterized protein n=1 Tax=Geothermobacter ehrlichii TaxID=213224 RepID=A0A5D3WPN5_9BACT|nr:hypothetical protein [Geothermobacter ehrlichii]TYO99651.1 hypothetical protein EDC39_102176 [Geothermobacter ehrlichii]